MTRIANKTGFLLVLALAGIPAWGQQQASSNTQSASSGQSLGDYARHMRKNPETPSRAHKVYDNDDLPKSESLSIVGRQAPPAGSEAAENTAETASQASATGETKPAPQPGTPEDKSAREAAVKQWTDRIDDQQKQVDLLSRELDVTQREYQLRAAAMYADAGNRLRNSAQWDKQDAEYKQQIADKQKALDDAKQKLDGIKEGAQKAGMPASVQETGQSQ